MRTSCEDHERRNGEISYGLHIRRMREVVCAVASRRQSGLGRQPEMNFENERTLTQRRKDSRRAATRADGRDNFSLYISLGLRFIARPWRNLSVWGMRGRLGSRAELSPVRLPRRTSWVFQANDNDESATSVPRGT